MTNTAIPARHIPTSPSATGRLIAADRIWSSSQSVYGLVMPSLPPPTPAFVISDEVRTAQAESRPVVALETTIFSNLGLPAPANEQALSQCIAAVRESGSVPALTAVLDGVARVGVDSHEFDRILSGKQKCAERDLPVAVGQRWADGMTTVSASIALAALAGISVFATGGIGGVHRDDHLTGDVSADLRAIGRHCVITVTAGAKAFLDLGKTLELFDSLGVPVLGYKTDKFPAFYTRDSGYGVQRRIDHPAEAAQILLARTALGMPGGVIVANPIPEEAELPQELVDQAIREALADASRHGLRGASVTPFVLGRLATATAGRSIPANLALATSNAEVAGLISSSLTDLGG
jgi:pseudouridylate synthase